MPTIPHTTPTGLRIGRQWQPVQRVSMSDDALALQSALLARRPAPLFARSRAAHHAVTAALAVGAVVALLVAAGVWP